MQHATSFPKAFLEVFEQQKNVKIIKMELHKESAGPWARRVLSDWFVCYPSSSFVFSLIVRTARIFDKSNFPPPSPHFPPPQPKGPAEQSAGVNMKRKSESILPGPSNAIHVFPAKTHDSSVSESVLTHYNNKVLLT